MPHLKALQRLVSAVVEGDQDASRARHNSLGVHNKLTEARTIRKYQMIRTCAVLMACLSHLSEENAHHH